MKRNNLFCTVVAVCSLLIASCSQNDEIMEQQDVKKGSIRIIVPLSLTGIRLVFMQ